MPDCVTTTTRLPSAWRQGVESCRGRHWEPSGEGLFAGQGMFERRHGEPDRLHLIAERVRRGSADGAASRSHSSRWARSLLIP